MSEFTFLVDRRRLPTGPVTLAADADQRAALAKRFGLVAIESLGATVTLEDDGKVVSAQGQLGASIVQSCAVSGDDLPVAIDEPIALRFVPEQASAAEEVELGSGDLDEIAFEGDVFDLGEAVAQSLALAIDPYAVGPDAERVRKEAGLGDEEASGPFAALAALRKP